MGINSKWKQFKKGLFNSLADSEGKPLPSQTAEKDKLENASAPSGSRDALEALSNCAKALHSFKDPKVISFQVMKTLREYYSADFVGVLEINIDLDNWFLRWASREGYDTIEEDDIKKLIRPDEYTHHFKTWLKAYKNNLPVIVEEVAAIRSICPEEYELYTRLEAESVMGIPFYKNSNGFVVVRNAKSHFGEITFLQLCSYALMMELNEYKMIQSLRLQAEPFQITNENEVRINLFDGLTITHIGGRYIQSNFSPDQQALLYYLAIYRKVCGARELESRIWENEAELQEGQKVRRTVHGIVGKCTLLKHQLISRDDRGYWFNPELKIVIDAEHFQELIDSLRFVSDVTAQKKILKEIIALYKGPIVLDANAPAWLIQDQHYFESRYLTAIKRLLQIFYMEGDFESLHQYAAKSMEIVANNTEGFYWKIRVYRKLARLDKANSLLETAQKCLPAEEYESLCYRLETMDDQDPDHVF